MVENLNADDLLESLRRMKTLNGQCIVVLGNKA